VTFVKKPHCWDKSDSFARLAISGNLGADARNSLTDLHFSPFPYDTHATDTAPAKTRQQGKVGFALTYVGWTARLFADTGIFAANG
jgi:hypothetical protein